MKFCVSLFFFFAFFGAKGQELIQPCHINEPSGKENIKVKTLFSDEQVSTFMIWIKNDVPLHYHASHSEQVYILKGKGTMQLGEESIAVKKGDWIFIPKGTHHGVEVTSNRSLKVISIQAPHFDGTDRHPVKTTK